MSGPRTPISGGDKQKETLSNSPMAEEFRKVRRRAVKVSGADTGTEYDHKKNNDLKDKERKQWEGVPGLSDGEDFTWHHLVPQSKLEKKSLAQNPAMMRLGPSASYRDHDPGNSYLDLNHDEAGRLTPFSEKIDDIFNEKEGQTLDLGELNERLEALAAKEDRESKVGASVPKSWFILVSRLKDLTHASSERASIEKVIAHNTKNIRYLNGKSEGQEVLEGDAVQVTALRKNDIASVIGVDKADAVFKAVDAAIKGQSEVFVHAYTPSEVEKLKSDIRHRLGVSMHAELDRRIDASGKIAKQAVLMESLIDKIGTLIDLRAKLEVSISELTVFDQEAGTYYKSGDVALDTESLAACNTQAKTYRARQDLVPNASSLQALAIPKGIDADAALAGLIGKDRALGADQEKALREQADAAATKEVDDLKYREKKNFCKSFTNSKSKKKSYVTAFILTETEEAALKTSTKNEYDASLDKVKQYQNRTKLKLAAFIAEKKQEASDRIFEELKSDAERAASIEEGKASSSAFLKAQNERILAVNAQARTFLECCSIAPTASRAELAPNAYLKTYWKRGWNKVKVDFKAKLSTVTIRPDPTEKSQLGEYQHALEERYLAICAETVQQIEDQLG
ncbi:MAG: hypothetical protein AAGG09_03375 [Pseudomonadota bacterium]